MKNQLSRRFWIELGLGLVSTVLLIMTVVWSDWIELVLHVDPDNGSGAAEWLVVAVSLATSVVFFALARYEWRRMAASRLDHRAAYKCDPLMVLTSGSAGMLLGLVDGPVALNHLELARESIRQIPGRVRALRLS